MSLIDSVRATDTAVADTAGAPLRGRPERPGVSRLYSVALLTLGVAAIHFAAAADHMPEYVPWGVFFIGLGIAQVTMAIAVVAAPSRRLFIAAAVGTAAVIGLWLISRTVGVPIAPQPWHPEPAGLLDFMATVLETISIVLFLLLIRSPRRPKARGRIRIGFATVPAALLAVLAGWLGVGSALNPMPVVFNAAPAVVGQASTSVANLVATPGNEPVKSFTLTAGVTMIGGRQAWAYNGTVPGPELRVTQGDRVRVTVVNQLPDPTSIHWHGIRVPGAEDGVAGITQDAVPPGRSYTYEFIAYDAGTFWYHSHQDASNQVPRGLLGAITVEPRTAAVRERDYNLMVHLLPGTDTIAVNGSPKLQLEAAPGEIVRLRITNGAQPGLDGAPLTPVLFGAPYVVAALDGHDLNAPQELGPKRIPLGMGQRADLVFKMPASGAVSLNGIKGVAPFLPFGPPQSTASVTIGDGPVPVAANVGSLPPFDLTGYGLPASDPVADTGRYDVTREIVLNGGPMFRNGGWDFSDTFNGMASPNIPAILVREGQLVRLHIVNRSPKFHPIHIHGHVFSVLARNGRPLSGSPVHVDAILVGPGETWDVAFKADNPGIWMLHCHVLGHAVAGMSMTINYQGISTPFTMGVRSGNVSE